MAARRVNNPNAQPLTRRPATTPEARENQLIAAAVDLAERQLADGTASAQVLSHYLKLGSSREKLEQQRLAQEVGLLQIKKEQIESAARVEEMYGKALEAMRTYSGQTVSEPENDYDD